MNRGIRWRDLVAGFASVAVIIAVAVLILVFGRAGALHGRKFTLFVTTDGARGVIKGTEVWLDGQKVGLVSAVTFRPPSIEPHERLVLTLSVVNSARSHIRGDTHVEIRSGITVLGDQVISLNSGTASKREVRDGDTLHFGTQVDVEGIMSDASIAAREFPVIMRNVRLLGSQLRMAQGTLAAFGAEEGSSQLARLRLRTDHVLSMLGDSTGTFGLAMRASKNPDGDPARGRANHAMAQVDSIRQLLASNQHSLGRFRRDTTLKRELVRIRAELTDAQTMLKSQAGSLGRFRSDSAIMRSVARDRATVDSLFADLKKHPFRYISF